MELWSNSDSLNKNLAHKSRHSSKDKRSYLLHPIPTMPTTYHLENATSGRAKCKKCKEKIGKGELRIATSEFGPRTRVWGWSWGSSTEWIMWSRAPISLVLGCIASIFAIAAAVVSGGSAAAPDRSGRGPAPRHLCMRRRTNNILHPSRQYPSEPACHSLILPLPFVSVADSQKEDDDYAMTR